MCAVLPFALLWERKSGRPGVLTCLRVDAMKRVFMRPERGAADALKSGKVSECLHAYESRPNEIDRNVRTRAESWTE